jgi:hypothetical protein
MTNIFAVAVPDKESEYIFCVADSQATGNDDTKYSNSQKMIQRGNNILMSTGSVGAKIEVFEKTKNFNTSASELAQLILKETEELAKKFEGKDEMTTSIFVAGKTNDKLEMYNIDLFNTKLTKRGINPAGPIYSHGSGLRHVGPALNRDFEKGYQIYPKTPLEALMLCFSVGAKADTDLGVNEKLQLGVISKSATRLILPPNVDGYNLEECNSYMSNIAGFPFKWEDNMSKKVRDELNDISKCVDNFYLALETEMRRLLGLDTQANMYHSKFKTGDSDLGTYTSAVNDRSAAVKRAQIYFDAFMKGGIRELNTATRQFYEFQKELMKKVESSTAQKP